MSGVDFTLWSAHRQSINEGIRLWVNKRVSQSFTHNSIKEIWCNSHWFCLCLAKDQFVKGKRLVVIELMNMLMSQDTSFQIFGRGGNKHRKDQAWIGWHCPKQEPVVTKWCVIMLSVALARLGTLQGKRCYTVSPVTHTFSVLWGVWTAQYLQLSEQRLFNIWFF